MLEVTPCSVRRCSPSPTTRGSAAWSPATRPPGGRRSLRRGGDLDAATRRRPRAGADGCRSPWTTSARTSPTRAERRGHPRRLPRAARRPRRRSARPAREVSVKLSAFGQALPARRRTRSRWSWPRPVVRGGRPRSAPRSPSTWRTTAPSTRRSPPSPSCARSTPAPAPCSRRCCFRTEDDAKDLAVSGSRVRLVKGAYNEPADGGAPEEAKDVDAAYAAVPGDPDGGPGLPDGRLARPGDRAARP